MFRPVILLVMTLAACSASAAPEFNPFAGRHGSEPQARRVIVALRADANAPLAPLAATDALQARADLEAVRERLGRIAARRGLGLRVSHSIAPDTHVVYLDETLGVAAMGDVLAQLRADGEVAYAVPDRRKFAHAGAPNDPDFAAGQWYLKSSTTSAPSGTTTAAINAVTAWSTTTGAANLVIAVLDTGVRKDHPDLAGRLLPGYDFDGPDDGTGGTGVVAGKTYLTANDGDGWDADPSDPGDWIDANDVKQAVFSGCSQDPSSWHGTRVSGILGAATNNATGVAGLTWGPKLLPVRVLGKCGGFDSDIIAAMRWAAGLAVPGVPANATPAQVINLSLGGAASCSTSYQSAIDEIHASKSAVIVVSAGNEGGPVDEPANCNGVIGVTGVRHVGTKVGYANVSGSFSGIPGTVALAAPAGNCVNLAANTPCLFTLDTTTNEGTTVPAANGYTDQTNFNIGTSFSAPIVSGIAALMLSVNSKLTPDLVLARLQSGARAFPDIAKDSTGAAIPMCHVAASATDVQNIECNCTTATCGAGLADAAGAIAEALRPVASVQVSGTNAAGQTVQFDASGSFAADGQSIASYAWSVTSYSSYAPPTLGPTTGATSSLEIPSCGAVLVHLIVTDNAGHTDTVDQTFGSPPATGTTCPAPPSGHGGGALDGGTLAAGASLAALVLVARRRRRARSRAG